jgi:SAM-dependent methyltransferase
LHRNEATRHLLPRVTFQLVDWSPASLRDGKLRLEGMYDVKVEKHEYTDFEDFLKERDDRSIDFIVSVAGFHHKSFPDYLHQIRRTLADDGALVSGDWHSAFWHHPSNLYRLLESMGTENKRLDALREYMGDFLAPSPGWAPSPEEMQAMFDHFEYWHKVYEEVAELGTRGRTNLCMFKANQTSREHANNLAAAGFTTNADDIRKAFPGATLGEIPKRVLKGSDFAVVTAAIKKKG